MSNKPSAAYPLIARDLANYWRKLMDSPDSEYWIHEAGITRYLVSTGLSTNEIFGGGASSSAALSLLSTDQGDDISQLDGQMDQIAEEAMTLHQAVDDLRKTNEKKIDQSKSEMAERSWRGEEKDRRRPNLSVNVRWIISIGGYSSRRGGIYHSNQSDCELCIIYNGWITRRCEMYIQINECGNPFDVTSFMTDGESHVIGIASGSGGGIIGSSKDRLFDCIYFHMVWTRLMLRFIWHMRLGSEKSFYPGEMPWQMASK